MVEPGTERPTSVSKQPLVDEKEPDGDVAHAQPMEPQKGIRGTLTANDVDVFSWMDPNPPRDMGGFDTLRVELTGVPGIDLAVDVLDGDGKRLTTGNDGGPGEYEVVPNVAVEPAHTYYLRVREVGAPEGRSRPPLRADRDRRAAPARARSASPTTTSPTPRRSP